MVGVLRTRLKSGEMALRQATLPFLLLSSHLKNCPCPDDRLRASVVETGLKLWDARCLLHTNAPALQMSQAEVDASSSSNGSEANTQDPLASAAPQPQQQQQQQQQQPPSPAPPPRFRRVPAAPQQHQPSEIPPAPQYQSVPAAPPPPNFQRASPFPPFTQYKPASQPQTPTFNRPLPASNVVSVVPGMPATLAPPPAVILSLKEMKRLMVEHISAQRSPEALHLYNEWLKGINPETLETNTPDMGLWNIALHAQRLCGASVHDLLTRVEALRALGLSPNKDTFTVLFQAISSSSDHQSLERVFSKLMEVGLQIEAEWFDTAIITCLQNFDVALALKYVQLMAGNGVYPSGNTLDKLVQQCCRTGRTNSGLNIVTWCKLKGIYPSFFALEDLTDGCIETGNSDGALLALELAFERHSLSGYPSMNEAIRFPGTPCMDEGSMLALLEIAAQAGNLALATKAWDILCRSLKNARPPSPASFLARVHACVAAGDLMLALAALLDMEATYASEADKDMFSPFSSLSSFVSGCSRGGFATLDAAYFKVEEIASTKKMVPLSALNCLILGCSNIWDVDRAYQTFEAIWGVFGLTPNVHSYNALLDAFGKTRKTEDAMKLYDHMVESSLQPDYQTYCLLINAHVVNRDTQSAMEVFDYLVDAGYIIDKVTARKLHRRCIREHDEEGLTRIGNMMKKSKYSTGFLGNLRKRFLFQLN